jgi:3-deoxy-7-phosphoheptulonate synthase
MIIVMKPSATEGEIADVVERLTAESARVQRLDGERVTLTAGGGATGGATGGPTGRGHIDTMPGVDAVLPDGAGTPMVAPREPAIPASEVRGFEVRGRWIGGDEMFIAAGPCSVEDPATMHGIAEAVAGAGATALRAGAYKPRTSPYSFQGMGEEGLAIARDAADAHELLLVSEVVDAIQIPVAARYVDILQVGARNMANTSLLRELGRARRPVLLKRGLAATIDEWLGAAEYLVSAGNPHIILCERGIRTFETATRNTLDLNAVPVVRGRSHLPIVVDPSHGTGRRDCVQAMARAATAAGADGLLIEVHVDPDNAISDAAQTITPETFRRITRDVRAIREALA